MRSAPHRYPSGRNGGTERSLSCARWAGMRERAPRVGVGWCTGRAARMAGREEGAVTNAVRPSPVSIWSQRGYGAFTLVCSLGGDEGASAARSHMLATSL